MYLNIFFILLLCCCLASASKDCQRFCSFTVNERQLMNIDEEFKWCKNTILKVNSRKTLLQSAELINNGNFSFADIYMKLDGDADHYFNNDTFDLLRSVTGISLNYIQNITSFDKILKELPHLKLIVDFKFAFYPNRSEINTFLKEHIQDFHAADYLIGDEYVDLSMLSDEIKEKFVLELYKETFEFQAKSLGIKTYLNGIKHAVIDVTIDYMGHADKTFQQNTQAIDRNFVCPVSKSAVQLPPIIYCYYQLPTQSDSSFLSPDEIPSECNRIIVKGVEVYNGTIKFNDDVSKSYMEAFKNSTAAKIIGSLSCKNFYLGIGPPVSQSTLISNLLAFVESYNLEGLEISCEYIRETNSYNEFLMELKNKLGSSKILGLRFSPCTYYDNNDHNPLAQTPKSICAINNTVSESLDYYRLKTSSPSFFEFYSNIIKPEFEKSNPSKELEVLSSQGVFYHVSEYCVNDVPEAYQEAAKKKEYYPLQYDYNYNFYPDGDVITEIAYESTYNYKEMCTKWPEVFSQNSTSLNSPKYFNNISRYDSNSNNFFLSLDNGKLYYDNPAIMKYYSSKNIGALAFDSLNDDDWGGACGQGKFPVFKSFFGIR